MPYIAAKTREFLETTQVTANNPGELNYLITVQLNKYIKKHGLNYMNINAAVGVLECAKLELYRRLAVDYEESKKDLNGDVYL